MKLAMSVLLVILAVQNVRADLVSSEKLKCIDGKGFGFDIQFGNQNQLVGQSQYDGVIQFNNPQQNRAWLKLVEQKDGKFLSKKIFTLLGGGEVSVSSQVLLVPKYCGRGFCNEGSKKTISAALKNKNGQVYLFSCFEVL